MKLTKKFVIIGLSIMVCLAVTAVAPSAPAGIKKVISIPSAAFTSNGGIANYVKNWTQGYLEGVDGTDSLLAPVIFPNKAKRIKRVVVYAWDNYSAYADSFFFSRIHLATGSCELLGSIQTSDSDGVVGYEIPIDGEKKKLRSGYAYQIAAIVGPDVFVYGAVVFYK